MKAATFRVTSSFAVIFALCLGVTVWIVTRDGRAAFAAGFLALLVLPLGLAAYILYLWAWREAKRSSAVWWTYSLVTCCAFLSVLWGRLGPAGLPIMSYLVPTSIGLAVPIWAHSHYRPGEAISASDADFFGGYEVPIQDWIWRVDVTVNGVFLAILIFVPGG